MVVKNQPTLNKKAMNQAALSTDEIDPKKWVNQHAHDLYRFAMVRLHNPELAEELVQETFAAGIQAIDQYSGTGEPGAWLMGILRRKIVDHYRRKARRATRNIENDEAIANHVYDSKGHWQSFPRMFGRRPSYHLESEEIWEAFHQCLEDLPKKQAQAFEMREMEDRSTAEVCKELNISQSNLWVMLHRARNRLAKCLGQKLDLENVGSN